MKMPSPLPDVYSMEKQQRRELLKETRVRVAPMLKTQMSPNHLMPLLPNVQQK
ncbi:hypothetical protein LINPERHAP1_LOCUS10722 [Linum perenne]